METNITALTLKDILDLGTTGLLIIIAVTLWRRLNKVTDQLIEIRQKVDLVAGAVVPVLPPEPPVPVVAKVKPPAEPEKPKNR